jgi:hypothetical protein
VIRPSELDFGPVGELVLKLTLYLRGEFVRSLRNHQKVSLTVFLPNQYLYWSHV